MIIVIIILFLILFICNNLFFIYIPFKQKFNRLNISFIMYMLKFI